MRREYAASLELIAELTSRDVAVEVGYPSLAVLLRDVLRIGTAEAKRRIDQASAVSETPLVSGGVVPATLPATAAALREGALGPDHVEVIAKTLGGLPLHVADADRELAEQTLVDAARGLDARTLTKVGHRIRAALDQDGLPPDDRDLAEPVNELHLHTRRNGRLVLRGEFDPEASALITTVLSPLAKPHPTSETSPGDAQSMTTGPDLRSAADVQNRATSLDPRTPAERHGDALVEVFRLAADFGALPTEGGEKPHLLVTVPLDVLRNGISHAGGLFRSAEPADHATDRTGHHPIGHAILDGIGPINAASARRLACDARVIPVVLGSRSEPLDLGRASYTVPTALRRALILRDKGCAFPGCDRTNRWCHSHHIRHWADGGTTEPDNLVLLCGRHHRLIHHSQWQCTITHGRPEFRPPTFIDPAQQPRHNVVHA